MSRLTGGSAIYRCGCTINSDLGYHPLGSEKTPSETTALMSANTAKRAAERAKNGGKAAPALSAMRVDKVLATNPEESDTWAIPPVCAIHGEGAAVVSTWDYVPEEAKPLDGEVIGVDVLPKGVKP